MMHNHDNGRVVNLLEQLTELSKAQEMDAEKEAEQEQTRGKDKRGFNHFFI